MLGTENRRPDVYTKFTRQGHCVGRVVLDLCDTLEKNKLLEFGEPIDEDDRADCIWERRGRLQIIQTSFIAGRHYATKPSDFCPVIADLKALHAQGFVHGDIRCLNIVFHEQHHHRGAHLIDFDLGGGYSKDPPHYPRGYKAGLVDGGRCRAKGKIEKWHDWYALFYCMFKLHHFSPNAGRSKRKRGGTGAGYIFDDCIVNKPFEKKLSDADTEDLVREVEKFLIDIEADEWTCTADAVLVSLADDVDTF